MEKFIYHYTSFLGTKLKVILKNFLLFFETRRREEFEKHEIKS